MDKTIDRWTDPDGNGYAFKDTVARAQNRVTIDKMNAETADRKSELDIERKRIDNLVRALPNSAGEYQQSKMVLHGYGNAKTKCGTTSGQYTNVPAFTTDAGGVLSSLYTKKSNYQIAVNKAGLYLFELRIHINSLTANKRVELAPFVNGERNAALASSYNTAGNFTLTKIATLPMWLSTNDTIDFRIAPIEAAEVRVELGDVLVYAIDWDDKFKIPDYTGYVNETKDLRVGVDGTTYYTAGQAMREQIGSLKEDLGKISEITVDKTENLLDISKEKINIRPQGYNAGQSLNDLKLKQEEGWITYNVVSASPGDSFYFLQGTTIIRAFLELYNSDGAFSRGVQIENKRPVILQNDEKYILISKNWKTDPLGLSPDGTEQFKSTTADLNIYEAFGYKEKDLTKNENLMRYFESLQEKKQSKIRDVIIDTDWAGDVDDAVAIKTALWAEEQGLFKIKAILINSMEGNHCQTLNAFLTGYGRGDVPIGINNNGDNYLGLADWKKPLLTSASSITKNTECEDALRLYRKVLANNINKIDIISIGNFHNLSHLVDSEADYISDKTGLELVEDKVNIVYCMGGRYPSGSEYNFNRGGVAKTIEITKNFLGKWNTDVIFVGAEVADTIIVGSKLDNIDPKRKELLTQVLYAYNGNKPNIGRPAYDPCTVYLAAIGDAEKCGYDVVRGTVTIDDSGNNSFITSNTGKHYYVVKKKDDSWYQSLIDSTLYSLQGYYY